ncbi:TonB-dependent receptor [Marinilabiliaceae bacterium JC017]|nr:TonB-dependent receptor [Marinilabiliaceae bacterium JC017]
MIKKLQYISLVLLILTSNLMAQTGVIKGRVFNSINNETIPFANILIDSTLIGTTSDLNGNYRLENLKPGSYNVTCSYIGFEKAVFYEVMVSPAKPTILDIPLVETTKDIGEIKVMAAPFNKTEESPVSLRTISATEIFRNPGGNRDISKVIQALPGVASTVSFRNDIIVRGGGPNENRFYLDGIEVPNINHFATQGSSGGPVGMINVNFIREVDFYAGAFPANRGNTLSSVMEFKQISPNDERLSGTVMLGSSDLGLTLEGPSGENSAFIFSARRSYLQFLFKALSLPFLPTYNDFQYKHTFRLNAKNELTFLGLGAIDDFKLNKSVNEGLTDSSLIQRNNYLLNNLPVNTQWNYTIGAKWTHFSEHSYQTLVVSRNHLNNDAIKYKDNVESPEGLLLDYNSQEIENKVRLESTQRSNGWKWNLGVGYENARYTSSTFNQTEQNGQVVIIDFDSELTLHKFAVFTQLSKAFLNNRLTLSAGFRTDINDYSADMINPFDQFSPRFSASYAITSRLSANFNIGKYYQLPPYTVLGYRDSTNTLVNKDNNITYIRANHVVGGLEFNPTQYSKISVEGFYKTYSNYPFLLTDSISLANLGGDFGVIGSEAATSSSQGRSYGVEVLLQQKLSTSVYGILSYTWVRSEFKDKHGVYVPSSWDNHHILNITAGKKFKKNWEAGMKFRLLGGAPYTPYNVELSALKEVWDVTQQGIPDWDRLNTQRNPLSHGLDIRVDKKWFFKKWTLNTYLDIQNIYNNQAKTQSYIDVERDAAGNPIEDPNNPLAYKMTEIENTSGTILPSVGLMIEF